MTPLRRALILAAVVVAAGLVLWLKPAAVAPPAATPQVEDEAAVKATVVLFADPREAGSSCGCGEVIRLARSAGDRPGVVAREFDSRAGGEPARRHRVVAAPTVIILGPGGEEKARFVGESPEVVAGLRAAIAELGSVPGSSAP